MLLEQFFLQGLKERKTKVKTFAIADESKRVN